MDKLATEGVQFHMNENTTVIKEQGDNYTVSTESGLEITTNYVLDATGRRPNVNGIGLEEAGVNFTTRGI